MISIGAHAASAWSAGTSASTSPIRSALSAADGLAGEHHVHRRPHAQQPHRAHRATEPRMNARAAPPAGPARAGRRPRPRDSVHASASSMPPPSAKPCSRATVGQGRASIRSHSPWPRRIMASASSTEAQAVNSLMSAPAMNPLGLPERMTSPRGGVALDGVEHGAQLASARPRTACWRDLPGTSRRQLRRCRRRRRFDSSRRMLLMVHPLRTVKSQISGRWSDSRTSGT